MRKSIGILTAGGDSPGLNAAIRAIGKSAIKSHGWSVIGFRDGFRGLMQDRSVRLDGSALSGILTHGGTILGTGRDKVDAMDIGGNTMDMRAAMLETFHAHDLSALVCLGGGGTQKNALKLHVGYRGTVLNPRTQGTSVEIIELNGVHDVFPTAVSAATRTSAATAQNHANTRPKNHRHSAFDHHVSLPRFY